VSNDPAAALAATHREDWGRLLALLARQLRDLDLAEEALADAFARAVARWPEDGVPDRRAAWLLTTARRCALDTLRRRATLARKLPLLITDAEPDGDPLIDNEEEVVTTIPDERLRVLFTCCHPALEAPARVALTLRLLGGLSTAEIARAFLVSEPTMAARITRAKKKIALAGIPYRVPTDAELPDRLAGVLAVLYLVFNEGYAASAGAEPIRRELCAEAIRLSRVVVTHLPDEPEALALLALLLLQHSRRDARLDAAGRVVLLPAQDRERWRADEIDEGIALIRQAARRQPPGAYLLQAAIAAQHASAARAEETDWAEIARLYAALDSRTASPVVRLNRAVAVAEVDGPAAGLALLAGLDEALPQYHLLPSVRADLLRRLGRYRESIAAYDVALSLAGNAADLAFLAARRAEVAALLNGRD